MRCDVRAACVSAVRGPPRAACSARPTAPVGTKAVKPYGTSAPADPQRGQTKRHALLAPARRARAARPACRVPARARPPVRARCAHTHHHRSRITDHASPKAVSSAHDHEPRTTRSTIPCDPARCRLGSRAPARAAGRETNFNMLVLKKHAVRAVSLTLRTPCRARRIASQRSLS